MNLGSRNISRRKRRRPCMRKICSPGKPSKAIQKLHCLLFKQIFLYHSDYKLIIVSSSRLPVSKAEKQARRQVG